MVPPFGSGQTPLWGALGSSSDWRALERARTEHADLVAQYSRHATSQTARANASGGGAARDTRRDARLTRVQSQADEERADEQRDRTEQRTQARQFRQNQNQMQQQQFNHFYPGATRPSTPGLLTGGLPNLGSIPPTGGAAPLTPTGAARSILPSLVDGLADVITKGAGASLVDRLLVKLSFPVQAVACAGACRSRSSTPSPRRRACGGIGP